MSNSAAHTALVHAILADLGALPGVVLAANPCGHAVYTSESGKVSRVVYGWPAPGGPDLLAVLAPLGRMVALECKTGRARLTRAQRAVHAALRAVGVSVHTVATVAEARAAMGGLAA